MKEKIGLGILVCAIFGAFVLSTGLMTKGIEQSQYEESVIDGASVGGMICVWHNGEKVGCEHNVLMEGEEAIESQIKQATNNYKWDYLTLGNGTAPSDGSTSLDKEIGACNLSGTQANIADNGDGNWTLSKTFTSTCGTDGNPISVNTTAIYSSGSAIDTDYFAGTDFGRTIEMINQDQLTVRYRPVVQ